MKLIVLSHPSMLDREVEIIHSLFEAGMERFHLRKPDWDKKAYKSFLHHINAAYHPKISIHAHHELANEFDLGGIHFTEKHRESLAIEHLQKAKKANLLFSTSFHALEQLGKWDHVFDYAFLSPVFDSISKQGYQSTFEQGFKLSHDSTTKLIGLGGVKAGNISELATMGFAGAAVLGTIWKQANKALQHFEQLKQEITCVPTP